MNINKRLSTLCALGLSALAVGCDGGAASDGAGQSVNLQHGGAMPNLNLPTYQYGPSGSGINNNAPAAGTTDLTVDYNLALRTASIKLRGDLPSMAEIRQLQTAVAANLSDGSANDPQAVYTKMIDGFINDPAQNRAFTNQMVTFWRNQLRMGGTISGPFSDGGTVIKNVSLDTAPAFLGMLTATGADMRAAFTQTSSTCPTYNATSGTFTAGSCITPDPTKSMMGSNIPEGKQAGVLTDPGFMGQYYSNFGFRRQRVIQEVFACTRLPAEIAATPQIINSALYSAPWPLHSITSNAAVPSYTGARRAMGGTTVNSQEYASRTRSA